MPSSSTCKSMNEHDQPHRKQDTDLTNSLDDDAALQAKVTEAMSVYDEYLKSQPPGANGDKIPGKDDKPEDKA